MVVVVAVVVACCVSTSLSLRMELVELLTGLIPRDIAATGCGGVTGDDAVVILIISPSDDVTDSGNWTRLVVVVVLVVTKVILLLLRVVLFRSTRFDAAINVDGVDKVVDVLELVVLEDAWRVLFDVVNSNGS